MNKQYQPLPCCPEIEEAGKEWAYQQSRIRMCREIIASAPNTPKARNAQRLIDDINMQLGFRWTDLLRIAKSVHGPRPSNIEDEIMWIRKCHETALKFGEVYR